MHTGLTQPAFFSVERTSQGALPAHNGTRQQAQQRSHAVSPRRKAHNSLPGCVHCQCWPQGPRWRAATIDSARCSCRPHAADDRRPLAAHYSRIVHCPRQDGSWRGRQRVCPRVPARHQLKRHPSPASIEKHKTTTSSTRPSTRSQLSRHAVQAALPESKVQATPSKAQQLPQA